MTPENHSISYKIADLDVICELLPHDKNIGCNPVKVIIRSNDEKNQHLIAAQQSLCNAIRDKVNNTFRGSDWIDKECKHPNIIFADTVPPRPPSEEDLPAAVCFSGVCDVLEEFAKKFAKSLPQHQLYEELRNHARGAQPTR